MYRYRAPDCPSPAGRRGSPGATDARNAVARVALEDREEESLDVLSDILGRVKMSGSLYFTTEFTPPWGVRVPELGHAARFHLVLRGSCTVRVEPSGAAVRLERGDFALVPFGSAHALTDSPDTPATALEAVLEETGFEGRGALTYGGADEGGLTRMVCGHLAFDPALDHPILSSLPELIVLPWNRYQGTAALEAVFRIIAAEVQAERSGFEAVLNRLSEILFIEGVRFWAEEAPGRPGLLAALADPQVARAIVAIHEDPHRRWSLSELARRASMGRTAFTERFRALAGTTPVQYANHWRVQTAKRILLDTSATVERVAREMGYDSGASFSRAFRALTGVSPGAFRRDARARGREGLHWDAP